MRAVVTLFQSQPEKLKELYGKPYREFATLDEHRLHAPEQFDPDGNLKMDSYEAVFDLNVSKYAYFYGVSKAVESENMADACEELFKICGNPRRFEDLRTFFDYKGNLMSTGDVVRIQYKDEVTHLYFSGHYFHVINPVDVPVSASLLLKNHQFLIGLRPVHFELEDSESSLILVHLSNGEVILTRNAFAFCRSSWNRPIMHLNLVQLHSLGEWVIQASFGEPEYIEGGLNILTGIPISVSIQ